MNDRRHQERVLATIKVVWRMPGAAKVRVVHSFDLSADGMSFSSKEPLTFGDQIRIEINVTLPAIIRSEHQLEQVLITGPPIDQAAFVTGCVRSCTVEPKGSWRIGVEFEGPDKDMARNLLQEYINYAEEPDSPSA